MEKYYKVLTKNGKSTYANFDYSQYLPKNGNAGKWLPEINDLEICERGYHITKYWNMWYEEGARIYEVEYKGMLTIQDHCGVEEKAVCKTIRLLRDATEELVPGLKGNYNTGDCNTGYRNTGDWNTGDYNTGNCNTGYRNTGDYNTGDYNTGYFNTTTPKVRIFNEETDLKFDDIDFPNWIYVNSPKKDAFREAFIKASLDDVEKTLKLPNFDYAIFEEITGISKNDFDKKLRKDK